MKQILGLVLFAAPLRSFSALTQGTAPRSTRPLEARAEADVKEGRPMSLKSYLISQFKQSRGPVGNLAGWIMVRRSSNRLRNAWTAGLLNLKPRDRVL